MLSHSKAGQPMKITLKLMQDRQGKLFFSLHREDWFQLDKSWLEFPHPP